MSYTTTDLISSVKARASIPTNQTLFQTVDFLRFANEELFVNLIPLILSVRESYFIADYLYSITADQAEYEIPVRAIGGKLFDVKKVDGSNRTSLPLLQSEELDSSSSGLEGFYIEGNSVVLHPTPTATTGSLLLKHYRRPNTLVATTACAQVSSIDTLNNQVVVSTIPSTFTTGILVDFIKETAGFNCHAIDQEILGVSGTTITFSSLPTGLRVNDWIALATESPIPQIPLELHAVLSQMVAVKCLEAIGDQKGMQLAEQKLQLMKDSLMNLITPRVDGENKKVYSKFGLAGYFRRG